MVRIEEMPRPSLPAKGCALYSCNKIIKVLEFTVILELKTLPAIHSEVRSVM